MSDLGVRPDRRSASATEADTSRWMRARWFARAVRSNEMMWREPGKKKLGPTLPIHVDNP